MCVTENYNPHAFLLKSFFKKSEGDIDFFRLSYFIVIASIPLLCYLLNHWTKFNQFWCVSYSHEWGVQWHFFGPAPWVGVKRTNIIKFRLPCQFQRPKMSFGQRHVAISIFNICKGHFGSRRGNHLKIN